MQFRNFMFFEPLSLTISYGRTNDLFKEYQYVRMTVTID